jgi:phenylacetic acid degradation operon negative regulatory protein
MTQYRNSRSRPLTARSVIASTLLGTDGLALPVQALIRAAELFGIAEGTTRVALSRMVAKGELDTDPGRYRLTGALVERSLAQGAGRRPRPEPWRGDWQMAVVTAEPRAAPDRAALRLAMARLHLAEWREGVWIRPHNLGSPERLPEAARVASEQCTWLTAVLRGDASAGAGLVGRLWDLDRWAADARDLQQEMASTMPSLAVGDAGALRDAFLVAAAVLRLLLADPVMPGPLLPPGWPGADLRRQYDEYEIALQDVMQRWFRASPPRPAPATLASPERS